MRILVFLTTLLLAMPAAAHDWVTAEKTGCRIWNEEPRAGETVTWTGRCIDGKAEGYGALIMEYARDGVQVLSIHWGEMAAGRSQGYGSWSTSIRTLE